MDAVFGIALVPYGGDVRVALGAVQQVHIADALQSGKMLVQLLAGQVVAELIPVDEFGTGIQALYAVQHLLIGLHALRDAADQLAHAEIEIGLRVLPRIHVGAMPQQARRAQANRQHQARNDGGAEQVLQRPAGALPRGGRVHGFGTGMGTTGLSEGVTIHLIVRYRTSRTQRFS